jgi:hypothetical protein
MEYENDNYLAKLLTDSSKIENLIDLLSFLKTLDPDRVKEQIGSDSTTSLAFSDKDLYRNYMRYEQHWFNYVSTLRDIILSGETNLSRVVKKMQDALTIKRPQEIDKAVFLGKLKKVPSEIITPWRDSLALTLLTKNCSQDIDCVVEMGSGPALFLFKFWLTNGPLDADYYALEITQAGRLCVSIMSCIEPNLKLKPLFFDYQNPDFSALRNKYKNVLIFSKGSIEQIQTLRDVFFEELLSISKQLTCVHYEPVGWQIVKPYKRNSLTRKHKLYCEKRKYNTNLWELLKKFESKRLININDYSINFSGKARHMETYISWTKVPK